MIITRTRPDFVYCLVTKTRELCVGDVRVHGSFLLLDLDGCLATAWLLLQNSLGRGIHGPSRSGTDELAARINGGVDLAEWSGYATEAR